MDNLSKLEDALWEAADNLRANGNVPYNEFFLPVMGIIFLRHASNRFEAADQQIQADRAAGKMKRAPVPADYRTRRALYLPEAARYDLILGQAKEKHLGEAVDDAMTAIENDFAPLKGVVPIRPHRDLMKRGFETPDGRRIAVDEAFKDPEHPFRIAIVCAMWLTGFDVESLSTLYLDKPMKAHTLMQAIARANRVYPGKACGVIVDYNGMQKSLNEALAAYAVDDDDSPGGTPGIVAPIEELLAALVEAIEEAEKHLRSLGFEPNRLIGAGGFERLEAFRDAKEALNTSQEARYRFQIIVTEMMARFNALVMEPSAFAYVERRDNLETILKKLDEHIDTTDVTQLLKELHKIVNAAVATAGRGADQADGLTVDLSKIDFEKLRAEFAKKVKHKHSALKDIQDVIESRLDALLRMNPRRIDYQTQYQEIIAAYNREKDRATVEATFARLFKFVQTLDAEQERHVREGLTDQELALFDLISKEKLSKKDRERLKQASRELLASLQKLLGPMPHWTQNTQTQAEVEVFILDRLGDALPIPPYTEEDAQTLSRNLYNYVFQRSETGEMFAEAA